MMLHPTRVDALSNVSKNKEYTNALVKIGDTLQWETGPQRLFADDYCIGQTYLLLYKKYGDEKMVANFRRLADSIVAMPQE